MAIKVVKENISRKVDNLGRISIPSGLRSRFSIKAGDELVFSTMNMDGVNYIAMTGDVEENNKYLEAIRVLEELKCEIPERLKEKGEIG